MQIIASEYLPADKWALMRDGKVVAIVARGAPIEDAACDAVMMPMADYDDLMRKMADDLYVDSLVKQAEIVANARAARKAQR